MVSKENLLEIIKNHSILYDLSHPDYKDLRKKEEIWEKIGAELGEGGEALKKIWKNLRDSYSRYLRSSKTSTGQSANSKYWQWAKQMEFLKPYLCFARTESNIEMSDQGVAESTHSEIPEGTDNREVCDASTRVKKRRRETESPSSVDQVLAYLGKKEPRKEDPTEQLFLALASSVKTFTPRRQALIKMKISQIVLEEELKEMEERSNSVIVPNTDKGIL